MRKCLNKGMVIFKDLRIMFFSITVVHWRLQIGGIRPIHLGFIKNHVYIYMVHNAGKSSFIEKIIGKQNLNFVFLPGDGQFFMQSLDEDFHKVILFEEFEVSKYPYNCLKRLLEGLCLMHIQLKVKLTKLLNGLVQL